MSRLWRRRLRLKIMVWVFLPTVLIFLAIAWVVFSAYQQVTEDAAVDRNQALTTLAAVKYKTDLDIYTNLLRDHTALLTGPNFLHEDNIHNVQSLLSSWRGRFELFDGGVVIINNHGILVGSEPTRLDSLGENWSAHPYFQQMLRNPQETFSNILPDGIEGANVAVVAVPIVGPQGQFLGLIAGMLRIEGDPVASLTRGVSQLEGGGEVTYLVDGNGRVLYHPDPTQIGVDLSAYTVVQRAQNGQAEAIRTQSQDGQEIVASFSPVPDTAWYLISEQEWEALIRANRNYVTYFGFLFLLGIILPALVVAFGSRQITRPIEQLNKVAQKVAHGQFGDTVAVNTNDEIEDLATQFNQMSVQLQESYASLERKLQEQIAIEATLRKSETRYRTLFEESPIALWEEDFSGAKQRIDQLKMEGVTNFRAHFQAHPEDLEACAANVAILNVNRAALNMLGYGNEDLSLTSLSQIFNQRSYDTFREELIALAEGQTTFMMETTGATIQGIPVYFVIHLVIVPGHEESWERIFISLTNITQRVQIENELRQHQEHLTELVAARTAQLTTLYDISKKVAASLDIDTILNTIVEGTVHIIRADKSLLLLIDQEAKTLLKSVGYGYEQQEVERQSYIEVQDGITGWVMQEKQPTISEDIQTDPRNKGIALINAQRSHDKSAIVVPLTIGEEVIGTLTAINGQDKLRFAPADLDLVGMLARRAADAIHNARLYEAAQEADRIKSAFLASMSHELRTPLNSIIGFTGIILQGLAGALNDEQAKQMRMVQGSARHLLALINDVLDISKIEAGEIRVENAPFNIQTAIDTVLHTVEPLAEKKNLKLESTIAPNVGQIVSDQRRVEQILLNLVNNAIKFTEAGEVWLKCDSDGTWLTIAVVDTGMGIKPESQHLLFAPFQQVGTGLDRQHEGTGLGLSICKRLVELLGGEIWFESEWQVGSTFSFTLPLTAKGG